MPKESQGNPNDEKLGKNIQNSDHDLNLLTSVLAKSVLVLLQDPPENEHVEWLYLTDSDIILFTEDRQHANIVRHTGKSMLRIYNDGGVLLFSKYANKMSSAALRRYLGGCAQKVLGRGCLPEDKTWISVSCATSILEKAKSAIKELEQGDVRCLTSSKSLASHQQ